MAYKEDERRGRVGELGVKNGAKKRGNTVKDIHCSSRGISDDIDLEINGRDCEVKTDYKICDTSNLFLETRAVHKDGSEKPGGFETSRAECIFYIDFYNRTLYIYLLSDLRAYAATHELREAACNKDGYKVVYGKLLQKDAVSHATFDL